MPDISALNGTAIDNVAEFDGLTVTDVPAIAAPAAAYSVRLLDTALGVPTYTGSAMRVREDSGDTETDIGFDTNGDLDTAAIATHCGTANGFVVTWYDQSGNGNDAEQPTAGGSALQPKIYDGSTQAVITENGKPALDFDGSNDFLAATGEAWTRLAFAGVMYIDVPDDSIALQYGLTNARFMLGVGGKASANKIASQVYDGAFFGADGADITDGQYLVYNDASISPDTNEMYLDGTAVSQAYETRSGLPTTATYTIGCRGNDAFHFLGKFQELTIWTSDQSDNRTDIETNINSEYLIYQPTDAPTSGLLADYTGAAAAYSVRQLSDKAVIAMRIRRDSDDEERNIGFDANGDLDTTAISDFCGTANGYVTRWADQSTEGNHADQATDTSQPQIYNGTAVVTENGKPAVQFDGSDSHFTTSYTLAVTTTSYSGFIVSKTTNAAAQQILIQGGRTHLSYSSSNQLASFIGGAGTTSASAVGTNQILAEYIYDQSGTTVSIYANGSLLASQTRTGSSNNFLRIAEANDGRFNLDGVMQELVIWPTDQDADTNRTGIETDINTYFSIY